MLLSRKVRISIFFKIFFSLAHSVIFLTASNSPFETLAEATSILSIFNSSINNLAIANFSENFLVMIRFTLVIEKLRV